MMPANVYRRLEAEGSEEEEKKKKMESPWRHPGHAFFRILFLQAP